MSIERLQQLAARSLPVNPLPSTGPSQRLAEYFPPYAPDDPGLIVIPNTVSLVTGGPHPEAARRLVDFLLSKQVEEMLAAGDSAQIPVRADVPRPDSVLTLTDLELADIDWAAVGETYAAEVDGLEAFFTGADG